jgi:hypothetical protein
VKITLDQKKGEESKSRNLSISDFYIYFANIIRIFIDEYGFKNSVDQSMPIDKDGQPLPLYTYPAIEYIKSIDFKGKKIFEYGSGNSTLFWLDKGAIVTSVENDESWRERLTRKIGKDKNHKLLFAKKKGYINAIMQDDAKYDLIVIDGSENRLECTKNALKKIKKDGVIILDNADWFANSAKLIRDELDFIQIDFYGFRPSKHNSAVTSVYFSRSSNLQAISDKQPSFALGGAKRNSYNDS